MTYKVIESGNVWIDYGIFPYEVWFNIIAIIPHPELKGDMIIKWNPRNNDTSWHLSEWYFNRRTHTYIGLTGEFNE